MPTTTATAFVPRLHSTCSDAPCSPCLGQGKNRSEIPPYIGQHDLMVKHPSFLHLIPAWLSGVPQRPGASSYREQLCKILGSARDAEGLGWYLFPAPAPCWAPSGVPCQPGGFGCGLSRKQQQQQMGPTSWPCSLLASQVPVSSAYWEQGRARDLHATGTIIPA